jgi:hypothetical protein
MLKQLQTRSLKNTICHFQQKVINYSNSILNIKMQFSVDDKKIQDAVKILKGTYSKIFLT